MSSLSGFGISPICGDHRCHNSAFSAIREIHCFPINSKELSFPGFRISGFFSGSGGPHGALRLRAGELVAGTTVAPRWIRWTSAATSGESRASSWLGETQWGRHTSKQHKAFENKITKAIIAVSIIGLGKNIQRDPVAGRSCLEKQEFKLLGFS